MIYHTRHFEFCPVNCLFVVLHPTHKFSIGAKHFRFWCYTAEKQNSPVREYFPLMETSSLPIIEGLQNLDLFWSLTVFENGFLTCHDWSDIRPCFKSPNEGRPAQLCCIYENQKCCGSTLIRIKPCNVVKFCILHR